MDSWGRTHLHTHTHAHVHARMHARTHKSIGGKWYFRSITWMRRIKAKAYYRMYSLKGIYPIYYKWNNYCHDAHEGGFLSQNLFFVWLTGLTVHPQIAHYDYCYHDYFQSTLLVTINKLFVPVTEQFAIFQCFVEDFPDVRLPSNLNCDSLHSQDLE